MFGNTPTPAPSSWHFGPHQYCLADSLSLNKCHRLTMCTTKSVSPTYAAKVMMTPPQYVAICPRIIQILCPLFRAVFLMIQCTQQTRHTHDKGKHLPVLQWEQLGLAPQHAFWQSSIVPAFGGTLQGQSLARQKSQCWSDPGARCPCLQCTHLHVSDACQKLDMRTKVCCC